MPTTNQPKPPKRETVTIGSHLLGWISERVNSNVPLDGQDGQYRYSYGMSAVRPGKKGHIAPAEIFASASFSDVGNAINSLPRAVVSSSDVANIPNAVPNSYMMLGGAASKAPRFVVTDNTNTVTSHHDVTAVNNFSTLPSTGFWGEDACFYPSVNGSVGSNSDYVFYSWNDSAHGDVGQYDVANNVYDDDYMSTVPTGAAALSFGVPHRMCVGPDRIMYVTNGQFLASYDGTSDTTDANGLFNPQALDLGPGWMAVDVQPYGQEYVAVAAVKCGTKYNVPSYATESRVIMWNGSDLDFSQLYSVDDWFIGCLVSIEGQLVAFTQGKNGTTKAKTLPQWPPYFQTVWEAPTAAVGGAPLPNQAELFNGMVVWNGDTTTNEVFGLMQTQQGWALHTPYYLSKGSGTLSQAGFLRNLDSNYLFAGISQSGFSVVGVPGDGTGESIIGAQALSYAEFRTRVIELPYKATVIKLKAYFSSFGSDSSVLISLIPNYTNYSQNMSGLPANDLLSWTISAATHPRAATDMTASTSEYGSGRLIPNVSKFWINVRNLNSSVSATPPILQKLEFVIEEVDKP
jgi:hypothetical protein